jgi:hypothetical protein
MPKFLDALGEKLGIVKKKPTPSPPTPTYPNLTETEPPTPAPQEFVPVPPVEKLVNWAKAQVGKPYSTYRDCSGFTAAAFRQIGVTIPEGSVAQFGVGTPLVEVEKRQPGDLLFWDTFGPAPGHVALYIGDGKVVHALNEQRGIVISEANADMGGPYMGARRLALDGQTPGKPEAPVVPSAVPVGTSASIVGANTNFRQCPRITVAQTRKIISDVSGSPFNTEIEAIHNAMQGDPLPLAQSWMESRYGQDPNAKLTKNPLGLLDGAGVNSPYAIGVERVNVGGGVTVPLLKFRTWADAFKEWRRRMDTPSYKGGVYPQGMTLREFIYTYVGGPDCLRLGRCGNGETPQTCEHYFGETRDRINRYYKIGTVVTPPPTNPSRPGQPYSVAGVGKDIILPFPLYQKIMPTSQTNQRPGIAMSPDRYVQHDTGNRNVGANARAHVTYLEQGAPDRWGNSQQLSYHFTVDDKEAWQMIPVNEVAWHGGDGAGPCNMRGISCELCINADINEPKSRENAAILAAEVMNALGVESLKKHQDCSGKHCPGDMLNDGFWPTFVQRVSSLRASRK